MRPPFALPPSSNGKERAMTTKWRRPEHQFTLQDRIIVWARQVRAQAAALPPGPDRELLLKKVQQAETALHLENWTHSPGLQESN
jgi:hypothetical protein